MDGVHRMSECSEGRDRNRHDIYVVGPTFNPRRCFGGIDTNDERIIVLGTKDIHVVWNKGVTCISSRMEIV